MASKGTTKYDYGKNGGKDVYGVDAPDFRESKEFAVYLDTVKAIIYAVDGITSRAIKAELGDLNDDLWTAEAISKLCADQDVAETGLNWVRYVRSTPTKVKVAEIDSRKVNEYRQYKREHYAQYPTFDLNF